MLLEGNVSVKAAILGNKRVVNDLYVDEKKKDRDVAFILRKAEEKGIAIHRVKRSVIDEMSTGRTHGGVIAIAEERVNDDLKSLVQKENLFLALVEGIEDPFNLGYVIRTLYAAGCDGLLIRQRDWKDSESVILKSSAGAFEYLPIIQSKDLAGDVAYLKSLGVTCYMAMRKDAVSYLEADYHQSCLICIGGEMRGLSSQVLAQSDQNIYIPYANDFRNALNAAAATSVLSYEVFRQRQVK